MNLDQRLIDSTVGDLAAVVKTIVQAEMMAMDRERPSNATEKYMPAKDVCELYAISESTLNSYVSKKIIKKYRVGGNIRFRASEVAKLVK